LKPLLIALSLATLAHADSGAETGIDLHLISDVRSVAPGQTFTVGLDIRHHPGFHTYWKNPGKVGVSTTLTWTLPEGFSAGETRYPTPTRVKMFDITAYGYRSDTILLTDIRAPETLTPGTKLTLSGKAIWMACSKICLPGNRTLSLTLPVAPRNSPPDPDPRGRLAEARQNIPPPLPLEGASAWVSTGTITLTFPLKKPPSPGTSLYFFCDDNIVDSDAPQTLTHDGSDTIFTLAIPLFDTAKKLPRKLGGVLVNPAGWKSLGGQKAGTISIPLTVSGGGRPQ